MPDITRVTEREVHELGCLANVYSGKPYYGTWTEIRCVVEDPRGLPTLDDAAVVAHIDVPPLTLGGRQLAMKSPLMVTYFTPRISAGLDVLSTESHNEVGLVAGEDNRRIVSLPDWDLTVDSDSSAAGSGC